ncbi:voltage-gated potassium channel [Psychromicrobium silvestre]|uniref:Voltage-gated potassium channel n=1 Tax=Psychromicrobium silvestre TaxID=1645614 RepID=A0A7Y9LSN8_9MICC|nr:potassium channel family protein [Psychromicrobium silvestre]NYE94868.1 voltage-gated potassium channel [Psychromicrobium silvestre]
MTQEAWQKHSQWPMVAASLIFLVAYSIQVIADLGPDQSRAIDLIITITWLAFGADYLISLLLAPKKVRWFLRNLHELVILVLPVLRPLRLLRLLTLLKILHRASGNALRGRIITYVIVSAGLLIYAGSLAVLDAEENAAGSNITNFWDALWWSMTTITTVGYGDHYPVTVLGRLVAIGLMIGGITVLGVVTASFASWLIERVKNETVYETEQEDESLRIEISRLASEVARLSAQLESRKS